MSPYPLTHAAITLGGVLALATLHLLATPVAKFLEARRSWLFAAAGLSVAYAFVHLLPDLAEEQAAWLEALPDRPLRWLRAQVYVAALIGLLTVYSLRRLSRMRERGRFWLDAGTLSVYHVLIGATIARSHGWLAVALTVMAFGAHFLVSDVSLRRSHGSLYSRVCPRLFAFSLVSGWVIGTLFAIPPPVNALVVGLLAGSVLLNVLGEEIQRVERVAAFVAGALAYTILLLLLDFVTAPQP